MQLCFLKETGCQGFSTFLYKFYDIILSSRHVDGKMFRLYHSLRFLQSQGYVLQNFEDSLLLFEASQETDFIWQGFEMFFETIFFIADNL